MQSFKLLLFSALLVMNQATFSHGSHHDHSDKGPNGGQLIEAEPYHLELVKSADEIKIYVSDEDQKKVDVKGAQGKATILIGSEKTEVPLTPGAGNVMVGKTKISGKAKLVVSITLAGKKTPIQGRFSIKEKK